MEDIATEEEVAGAAAAPNVVEASMAAPAQRTHEAEAEETIQPDLQLAGVEEEERAAADVVQTANKGSSARAEAHAEALLAAWLTAEGPREVATMGKHDLDRGTESVAREVARPTAAEVVMGGVAEETSRPEAKRAAESLVAMNVARAAALAAANAGEATASLITQSCVKAAVSTPKRPASQGRGHHDTLPADDALHAEIEEALKLKRPIGRLTRRQRRRLRQRFGDQQQFFSALSND